MPSASWRLNGCTAHIDRRDQDGCKRAGRGPNIDPAAKARGRGMVQLPPALHGSGVLQVAISQPAGPRRWKHQTSDHRMVNSSSVVGVRRNWSAAAKSNLSISLLCSLNR